MKDRGRFELDVTGKRVKPAILIVGPFVLAPIMLYCYVLLAFHLDNLVYAPVEQIPEAIAKGAKMIATSMQIALLGLLSLGLVIAPICLLLAVAKRRWRIRLVICSIVTAILLLEGVIAVQALRKRYEGQEYKKVFHQALLRVTDNAKPFIEALESYREENGKYPSFSELLVPAYISSIPRTGLAGYPEFRYYKMEDDCYEICVAMSRGSTNFDEFSYRSDGVYPKGPAYEPIDHWIYFHE